MQNIDKYKDAYMREARQYLETLNSSLIKLEKTPGSQALFGPMLYACHTYKGISSIARYTQTSLLCHAIEDVLIMVKKGELKIDACADLLFKCLDVLEASLKAVSKDEEELDTAGFVKKLQSLTINHQPSTINDQLPTTNHELPSTNYEPSLAMPMKIQSIDVKVERLDLLMRLSEELLTAKLSLERIKDVLQDPELTNIADTFNRLVSDLQFNVMQSRTVPLNFVFNRFSRLVRDIAKQQKKDVNFEITGGDIELDRSIVETLAEPLVHLIRNAVDHGIGTPKERESVRKSPQASLKLSAKRERGCAIIEVSDDGKGIDWEEVRKRALKLKLISAHSLQEELVNALFSGMSTTKEVTQISGRGFGLNIVKQKIESLGGSVKVESQVSKGTKFILEIPLTLAVFKVLFVSVGQKSYAISLSNVERLVHVNKSDIKGMMDYEAIVFDGEDIPITRLNELFNLPRLDLDLQPIVIVKKEEGILGLVVDDFGQTQEIVLKPLKMAKEGKYFTGCTILGSGGVALVLDVANLILSKRSLVSRVRKCNNLKGADGPRM